MNDSSFKNIEILSNDNSSVDNFFLNNVKTNRKNYNNSYIKLNDYTNNKKEIIIEKKFLIEDNIFLNYIYYFMIIIFIISFVATLIKTSFLTMMLVLLFFDDFYKRKFKNYKIILFYECFLIYDIILNFIWTFKVSIHLWNSNYFDYSYLHIYRDVFVFLNFVSLFFEIFCFFLFILIILFSKNQSNKNKKILV